jgi:hypothetical protein
MALVSVAGIIPYRGVLFGMYDSSTLSKKVFKRYFTFGLHLNASS